MNSTAIWQNPPTIETSKQVKFSIKNLAEVFVSFITNLILSAKQHTKIATITPTPIKIKPIICKPPF